MANPDSGTLYVVATPIGNLSDITYRAVETLRQVDLILAEDTRHTRRLLDHYDVSTRLISYHHHSTSAKEKEILDRLATGQTLALVTDAGTPGIADPGGKLVEAARTAGHHIVPIPGPAAVTAALSASGLNADQFTFLGFLPHKKGRQTKLNSIAGLVQPVVLYESPYRLVKLLGELAERYPEAEVMVARELTKKFEEFRRGTPSALQLHYETHPPKGEIVIILRA